VKMMHSRMPHRTDLKVTSSSRASVGNSSSYVSPRASVDAFEGSDVAAQLRRWHAYFSPAVSRSSDCIAALAQTT
jgi:hypothetical protein